MNRPLGFGAKPQTIPAPIENPAKTIYGGDITCTDSS